MKLKIATVSVKESWFSSTKSEQSVALDVMNASNEFANNCIEPWAGGDRS